MHEVNAIFMTIPWLVAWQAQGIASRRDPYRFFM
jgi:hypothetical protein